MTDTDMRVSLSAEKQFVFRDAYNRGFVQIPRMVVACIGLSAQAKSVYNFIANYVFEHGKSSFPSVHRIAIACNMTAKSVVKYIDELVEKGLIKKERRGGGRTNDYYLKDAHEIGLLRVSEMLWTALDGAVNKVEGGGWERAYNALETLSRLISDRGYSITVLDCTDEVREAIENDLIAIMQGGEPTLVYIPKVKQTKTVGLDNIIGKNKDSYKDRHESEWKTDHFRYYFYDKFREFTGSTHPNTITVHRSIISRLLKQLDGDKTSLKRYIDAFFELDYDNKYMENFGSSARFNEITIYLKEGKKPFFLENKQRKQKKVNDNLEQEYKGIDEEEFIRRLRGDNE